MYKKLYLFIEGPHEKEFFARLGERIFKDKFDDIQLVPYSQESKEWIKKLLKSIKSMNANYIWFSDLNDAPCISKRKEKLREKFTDLDESKVIVVRKEIESWYLALLDGDSCKKFKINPYKFKDTDDIKKEQFDVLIPEKFDKISFMIEILDCASIETAKQRNTSFRYFIEKYCLMI
jgi:hypothetical protein